MRPDPKYSLHELTLSLGNNIYNYPRLSANDYDRSVFTYDAREAFGGFQKPSPENLYKTAVEAVGATDTWDIPTDFSGPVVIDTPMNPDVTYRAYGSPRFAFFNSGYAQMELTGVFTNTERVSPQYVYRFPQICANSYNPADIFVVYTHSETEDLFPTPSRRYLDVVQIDP